MGGQPDLAGVSHEYVAARGLRTHIALAGPEHAPPVVLVHGWPQNWWAWRHVIPSLATSHRVIAPDLRGHGWTEAPHGGYRKEELASDLLGVLNALGVERATWVGHDWGGWIGLIAALRAPDRFERMLTLCVPHLWTVPEPRHLALLSYQGPVSLPLLGPQLAARMVPSILQSGRGRDRLSPVDVEVFARNIPPRVSTAMYRTFLTRELVPIARGRYARSVLEVPTTLIIGARDLVTRGTRPGAVKGQPQLQVEVLGDAAHWVPEQQPQAIVDWIHSEQRVPGGTVRFAVEAAARQPDRHAPVQP